MTRRKKPDERNRAFREEGQTRNYAQKIDEFEIKGEEGKNASNSRRNRHRRKN